MADKQFPFGRHDGDAWTALDVARMRKAGTELICRACVLFFKTDWTELATSFGLPAHNDGLRPCVSCNADPDNMTNTSGMSHAGLPWRENRDEDYYDACDRCEFVVNLSAGEHAAITSLLAYDKRDSGARGRTLLQDIVVGGTQLLRGDRLEPCQAVPDIGRPFNDVSHFPLLNVHFWRPALEYITRHRNPIFNRRIGLTPKRTLSVDTLHSLYLGVMHALVRYVIWYLLLAHLWSRTGTAEERLRLDLLSMAADLLCFYKAYDREHKGRRPKLTRISKMSKKIVGDQSDQKLKSKGPKLLLCSCTVVTF